MSSGYKVLITTSGVGSPLGELTKYTNKALIRVGKKPAISYIIEAYPKDTEYVVTVGYFSDQVKDFLSLAYPDRRFEFIDVEKYDGEGSSLGYSMLCAKDVLQCPFIFHAADTIVTEAIPAPEKNWIGVVKEGNTAQYASWKMIGSEKLVFNQKGAIDYDYIHIGLVGVNDYKIYWNSLESLYKKNANDGSLNDCRVVEAMVMAGSKFAPYSFSGWYDTGNPLTLKHARSVIADQFNNLDKLEEAIFFFDDFVVKYFYDEKITAERIARGKALGSLVPKIEGEAKNFYRYKYAEGSNYADVATPADFSHFLSWVKSNLWQPVQGVNATVFKNTCKDFYFEKTKKRVQKFHSQNSLEDVEHQINGETVPTIEAMLSMIDWEWLSDAKPHQFHGDFILENVIKTEEGYSLIDWRQNFGGLLDAGDVYYDLAKLNHNLTVNHDMINKNHFTIVTDQDAGVMCDIFRKNNLVECQEVLWRFIETEGYDLKRVRLLSGIIWLNMSPLHHHPFDQFLYYFGKLHLWRAIQDLRG